jgi:hypothetical protein
MTTAVAIAVGGLLALSAMFGLVGLRGRPGMAWAKALLLMGLIALVLAFAWMALMVFVVGPSMRGA